MKYIKTYEDIQIDFDDWYEEENDDTLNIGDFVRFKNTNSNKIPKYYTNQNSSIPSEKIKHGIILFKVNRGEIVDKHGEYYLVKYQTVRELDGSYYPVLGFKEKDLEKI